MVREGATFDRLAGGEEEKEEEEEAKVRDKEVGMVEEKWRSIAAQLNLQCEVNKCSATHCKSYSPGFEHRSYSALAAAYEA